ncbi:hypothetical protein ACRQ5Q_10505 [Bradyrhizobium sp. PMVTL-01]|uniref:hypothetical protein n=1 Tax=Bradyrhizobium sp. PMVTL-01 TaxID=3434999 RepID=UPI003F6F6D38
MTAYPERNQDVLSNDPCRNSQPKGIKAGETLAVVEVMKIYDVLRAECHGTSISSTQAPSPSSP